MATPANSTTSASDRANADRSTSPMAGPLTGDQPMLLGAATNIARRCDVDPVVVRLAFVVLVAAGGGGLLLYLAVWFVIVRGRVLPPRPEPSQRDDPARALGIVCITAGALLAMRSSVPGFRDQLVWPTAIVGFGMALSWRRVDLFDDRPKIQLVRLVAGLMLVIGGLVFFAGGDQSWQSARDGVVAIIVVLTGALVILGPWAVQLWHSAGDERRQRIRAEERADMAAHLHDSVLQTLTLMQRRSDDPALMAALARQQERALRRWLYGGGEANATPSTNDFRDAVEEIVNEVEQQHLIVIDTVTVGNAPLDEQLTALLAAAREALINAAKFSQQRSVSLFAELGETSAEIWVRDRGVGFARDDVPHDRRGITDSIVGRMHRVGGRAEIKTELGHGTEVHLLVSRP